VTYTRQILLLGERHEGDSGGREAWQGWGT